MSSQGSFIDLLLPQPAPAPASPRDPDGPLHFRNLFFALLPDAPAGLSAGAVVAQLSQRVRLTGKPIAPERLHVSLHSLGTMPFLSSALVDKACRVAENMTGSLFRIEFRQALSHRRNSGGNPFVIEAEDGDHPGALKAFHQRLGAALRRAGIGDYVNDRFSPHMTLVYDPLLIPPYAITPVSWQVNDFVLIESLVGLSTYRELGRWSLREG